MITAFRTYAVMAPFTVLIFKAVHPHISLGPIKMGNSPRAAYVQTIASVPYLDPKIYIYARLMIVNYPKRSIMEDSPILARTTTSSLLRGEEGLDCTSPQSLPSALMAFGTLRNQWEYLAKADAFNKTRVARLNSSYIIPSASTIASGFQWREKEEAQNPDISKIQAVLDGNDAGVVANIERDKKWLEYTEKCYGLLSQRSF